MRKSGILMPVASLPGRFGAGTFGREAYKFVDLLSGAGVRIWQILPLNPLGYGNSPYQPLSSCAGDELYIDLDILHEEGLLPEKPESFTSDRPDRIDYTAVREHKDRWLREAYRHFKPDRVYNKFLKFPWVRPYAVFAALKAKNGGRAWTEWPKEEQNWILDGQFDLSALEDEIAYRMFAQFEFYKQWMALKKYANSKKIEILGDIPFYVGLDSLDVWASRDEFLLNGDGSPVFIAGVPPDYFSEDGQRWGNPIYDWERLRQNGFKFWMERLSYSSRLYDILRIDHFRAFDTYWKIPADCPTARVGEWIEAPGYEFFDALYARMPKIKIVAEDLGDLRPEVGVLRDHYGLMGMNVLEFTLLDPGAPIRKNQLVYTGTHDNQTVMGWVKDRTRAERTEIRRLTAPYGSPREKLSKRLVRMAMLSKASIAIVPMSDVLGLDDRARLNEPGTVGSPNWEWRMGSFDGFKRHIPELRKLLVQSKRV